MNTKLGFPLLTIFALPALVSAVMHGPIAGILPALYSEKFGLDLIVIGSVLLIARSFDAVTDPMIGYLSDRTVSPYGRRKPWIFAGMILTTISIYFLFSPGETSSMTYFLVFSLLIYLGWTVMEIPYASWILELSRDTKIRTKISSFRTFALFAGGLLFTIMPTLIPGSGGKMNFEVLGFLALVLLFAVPVTTLMAIRYVPQGEVVENTEKPELGELWGSLKGNKPFRYFLAAYLFIGLASGFGGVLSFMYIDSYLEIGHRYTELFAPAIIIGPTVIPFWLWVLNKVGKYRVTSIAFLIYGLLMPLPWFVSPGEQAFLPMLIYFCSTTAFMPLLMITMPTILGDVIDYDEIQTGKNRAGQYYAFLALITKGTAAVGGPIALLAVGLFGYQPGVENSDDAILGLRIINNIIPAVMVIPAVYLLWRFPITDETQPELTRELQKRVANQQTIPQE